MRQGGDRAPLISRPRPGGIPLPIVTIGILVLAAAVLGLAIWIQNLGGDDDESLTPAEVLQTQTANRTQEARQTPPPTVPPGTPPPTRTTPGPAQTAQTGTPASGTTPGPGGTYTVKSGDTCGGIAEANNVPLADFLRINDLNDEKCTQLQIGQVLRLR